MTLHVRLSTLAQFTQLRLALFFGRVLNALEYVGQAEVFPELFGKANQNAGTNQVQTAVVLFIKADSLNSTVDIASLVEGLEQPTKYR